MIGRPVAKLNDLAISDPDTRDKAVLFLRKARIKVERPCDVFCRDTLEKASDGLYRHLTRDIAGLMAPHSVSDYEKVVLGHHDEAIFVVIALETHVRKTRCHCSHHDCLGPSG